MTPTTLRFPDTAVYRAGTESTISREAYLRGLAFVDDYTSERDEARTTPELHQVSLLDLPSFARTAELAGPLGPTLVESAATSSLLRLSGHSNRSTNGLAQNEHLRFSMRERILDLFECLTRTIGGTSTVAEYDPSALTVAATSRDVNRMRRSGFPDSLIRRSLEISESELETASSAAPAPTLFGSDLPQFSAVDHQAYTHTNSRGITYFLARTEVTLRGGKPQTVYFFSKVPIPGKGIPAPLPADRVVKENPRNGFLTVSKRE